MSKIPTVIDGTMETNGDIIKLNSREWLDWLASHNSFRYEPQSQETGFTARAEKSGYWYGYRKISGKLHKRYIGKLEELTLERLNEVAVLLNEPQQPREKKVTQEVTQDISVTMYATNDDITQLWRALAELRSEVVALGKLKAR